MHKKPDLKEVVKEYSEEEDVRRTGLTITEAICHDFKESLSLDPEKEYSIKEIITNLPEDVKFSNLIDWVFLRADWRGVDVQKTNFFIKLMDSFLLLYNPGGVSAEQEFEITALDQENYDNFMSVFGSLSDKQDELLKRAVMNLFV